MTPPTDQTTRQYIEQELRRRPAARPTALVDMLDDHDIDATPHDVLEHITHIKKSLNPAERLYGAPPECRDCGFNEFDDILNIPSRCPECKSEWVEEPQFTIKPDDS